MVVKMKYIANCSFGKDSLAMVLYILENGLPLDEVVFYDTGMEFCAVYRNRDRLLTMLREKGIQYTELRPRNAFLYDMLERPVESRQKGRHTGYGWCGGVCRWGTTWKTQVLDRYAQGAVQYIGIAADEQYRRRKLTKNKRPVLAEYGMTEGDCLAYCRRRDWDWQEESPVTESGYVELYDILDRVSCWCCANKNKKELKNIWRYLPQYWKRLQYIQSRLERPMKQWENRKYGAYGDVFSMEKVFRMEAKEKCGY